MLILTLRLALLKRSHGTHPDPALCSHLASSPLSIPISATELLELMLCFHSDPSSRTVAPALKMVDATGPYQINASIEDGPKFLGPRTKRTAWLLVDVPRMPTLRAPRADSALGILCPWRER